MDTVNIGLLGLGTVGGGTLQLLKRHADAIERRTGRRVQVRRALVRDLAKPRPAEAADVAVTTDPDEILDDPAIHIVVELVGGCEPTRAWVLRAIAAGKHVITANKALIAQHGNDAGFRGSRRRGNREGNAAADRTRRSINHATIGVKQRLRPLAEFAAIGNENVVVPQPRSHGKHHIQRMHAARMRNDFRAIFCPRGWTPGHGFGHRGQPEGIHPRLHVRPFAQKGQTTNRIDSPLPPLQRSRSVGGVVHGLLQNVLVGIDLQEALSACKQVGHSKLEAPIEFLAQEQHHVGLREQFGVQAQAGIVHAAWAFGGDGWYRRSFAHCSKRFPRRTAAKRWPGHNQRTPSRKQAQKFGDIERLAKFP